MTISLYNGSVTHVSGDRDISVITEGYIYIPMNFVEFTEFKESWHNPKMVGLPGVIPIWQ